MANKSGLSSPSRSSEMGSNYSSCVHYDYLRDNVEKLRAEGGYTDLTITVGKQKFPCHRVILAAGSPYFKSMFSSGMEESRKNVIEIKEADSEVFEHVLHFIYTGTVCITEAVAQDLFTQAHMFQINQLVDLSVQFFQENISESNCLGALTLADIHAHKPLYEFVKKFACEHFLQLTRDEDFLKLSFDCLYDLLKDRRLNCKREEDVFDIAIKWIEFGERSKLDHAKVLECIKFPLIRQNYLMDTVLKCPYLTGDPDSSYYKSKDLLEDAILYHTVPSRRNMLPAYQTTPRYAFPQFETAVLLGGRLMDGLSNEVECYKTDTKDFTTLKQLPFKKRNEFAACVVGNEIYVSGGLRSSEFWKYDPTFETWLRGANMLHARRRHAMAAVDDTIYVLGGFDEDEVLSSIESWNSKSNVWEESGNLNVPVENMGYVAYGKKVYLFGGKNNDEVVTNTVQCFDTTNKSCMNLQKSLPSNDMCLTAIVLNSHIYVVGLEGVFRYSPTSELCEMLPDMTMPRDFVSLAVLDEKIYAFGGRRRGAKENLYSDLIECFDPENNSWSTVGTIPLPMYSYGCVKICLHKQGSDVANDRERVVP